MTAPSLNHSSLPSIFKIMLSTLVLLAMAGIAHSAPARGGLAASSKGAADDDDNFTGSTQNGFSQVLGNASDGCVAIMVAYARGTLEPGNVGSLAGPPAFRALSAAVGAGNLAVQGVEYPADIAGFLAGGDADGSALMAQLTTQAVTQCPDSKVYMMGYSQGGQLVHNAAAMLPDDVSAKVAGAVIFGDPDSGDPVGAIAAEKTKIICHKGDQICAGTALILAPHLTYGRDADEAAEFIASV